MSSLLERKSVPCDIQYHDATWHRSRIETLDSNSFENHDLEWQGQGGVCLRDFRAFYLVLGDFFGGIARHSEVEQKGGIAIIPLTGYLRAPVLLRFLRVYCHTGVILLEINEPFQQLYEKYRMAACYGLREVIEILTGALSAKMDSQGCVHALLDLCGTELHDSPVTAVAEKYFKRHVFDCLKKLTSSLLAKVSDSQFEYILHLLSCDEVNSGESALWEELLSLLSRRYRSEEKCSEMLRLPEEDDADVAARETTAAGVSCEQSSEGPRKRLRASSEHCSSARAMQVIRVGGLTFEDIMAFRGKHPTLFVASYYMRLLSSLYGRKEETDSSAHPAARKHLQISSFPSHLSFPPTLRGSHVNTTLCAQNYSVSYIAVPWLKQGCVEIPPFLSAGRRVLTMSISYQGSHLHAGGTVDGGVTRESERPSLQTLLELRVINFARDRMRKSATTVVNCNGEYRMQKIILISTLENDYTFRPDIYPLVQAGSHILVKVITSLLAPASTVTTQSTTSLN